MTDTMTDLADEAAEKTARTARWAAERAAYVAGLRALAGLLEEHDELPLPDTGTTLDFNWYFTTEADERAVMAAAARALGCSWRKTFYEYVDSAALINLEGKLHGLLVKLTAHREAVCERVVTGTHEVTEMVPDPGALAAVPLVEVKRTVEDATWECHSILKPADEFLVQVEPFEFEIEMPEGVAV